MWPYNSRRVCAELCNIHRELHGRGHSDCCIYTPCHVIYTNTATCHTRQHSHTGTAYNKWYTCNCVIYIFAALDDNHIDLPFGCVRPSNMLCVFMCVACMERSRVIVFIMSVFMLWHPNALLCGAFFIGSSSQTRAAAYNISNKHMRMEYLAFGNRHNANTLMWSPVLAHTARTREREFIKPSSSVFLLLINKNIFNAQERTNIKWVTTTTNHKPQRINNYDLNSYQRRVHV